MCAARQWRVEDGRVCPAGQKAGLSGVGFEPTPPEETVIRIPCLRQLGHPSLSLYRGFLK